MRLNSLVLIGAAAFAASGLFNIVADFLPDTATRLLNFAGVCLGVFGLISLYLYGHPKIGRAGLAGFVLATFGFLGIAGFLFTDAFVFPHLEDEVTTALTNGATGLAIFAAVILYVLGVLLFATTLFRNHVVPKPALLLWVAGTLPTLFAIALPAIVMTIAEIVASLGVIWIAVAVIDGLRSGRWTYDSTAQPSDA